MGMVGMGSWLDEMILVVFASLLDTMIQKRTLRCLTVLPSCPAVGAPGLPRPNAHAIPQLFWDCCLGEHTNGEQVSLQHSWLTHHMVLSCQTPNPQISAVYFHFPPMPILSYSNPAEIRTKMKIMREPRIRCPLLFICQQGTFSACSITAAPQCAP